MDIAKQPLVSIIFTSYNHKEYLQQALDSLIDQTYANTEIIVIDDNSSDGSKEYFSGKKPGKYLFHRVYAHPGLWKHLKQWSKICQF